MIEFKTQDGNLIRVVNNTAKYGGSITLKIDGAYAYDHADVMLTKEETEKLIGAVIQDYMVIKAQYRRSFLTMKCLVQQTVNHLI